MLFYSSCKLLLFNYCSTCYCFRAWGIVSIVCSNCSLKGFRAIYVRPYESCYLTHALREGFITTEQSLLPLEEDAEVGMDAWMPACNAHMTRVEL